MALDTNGLERSGVAAAATPVCFKKRRLEIGGSLLVLILVVLLLGWFQFEEAVQGKRFASSTAFFYGSHISSQKFGRASVF
jgi:hypothetical protein